MGSNPKEKEPIIRTGDSEFDDILIESFRSTKFFSQVFLSDRFYSEMTPFHDEIFDAIDSGEKKIVIAAPRGLGKTSIVNLAYPIKKIIFKSIHYFVSASQSATSATLQTENLKRELLSNKMIKRAIQYMYNVNSVKTMKVDGMDESFSKESWVAMGSTMVFPRGQGQQIRGVLFGNYRPDFIVFDDLEDKETINNEDVRLKTKEWFYADAMKIVSRYDKNYQFVYIDTLKHEDALLEELLESPDWLSIRQSICDDNYKSLAPSIMSDEEIQTELETARKNNTLHIFSQEHMNKPVPSEGADFSHEYFKYYNENDIEFSEKLRKGEIETVLLVDPAKTTSSESAESAVVAVGIDQSGNGLYVRDIMHGHYHPHELYDIVFNMANALYVKVIGIEVNSLNEFITYPLRNEMMKRGLNFEIIDLKPRRGTGPGKGKVDRVRSLSPFYRKGEVYHNKSCCGPLEQQLLSFPRSKRWDVMDAFAYIVELMDMGMRFFYPKNDLEFSDPNVIENEYKELYNEPALSDEVYGIEGV